MPEGTIRLGLIGVGRWGRNYVKTIAGLADVRLALVASRNPDTAALLPSDCRIVGDWRSLVASDNIDGVVIASPPANHAEILIACIESGRPALVEKPVTRSRADAALVRAALERRRAVIVVGHTHLFHPAFLALREQVSRLGAIRAIRSSAGNHGPYRPDVPVLWDWVPHDLAMSLVLVPGTARPFRAARLDERRMDGGLGETIALDLELAGAVPAHIDASNLVDRHRWFAVSCDGATLVFRDFVQHKLMLYPPGADYLAGAGEVVPVDDGLPLTNAVLAFAQAIRTADHGRADIDRGLAVVDLIAGLEAVLESKS